MISVVLYSLAGAIIGGVAGRISRHNRTLFAAIGVVGALLVALLSQFSASADLLRAAFRSNPLIAASFFLAVCCAFSYQGVTFLAAEAAEDIRRRLLRVADFSGALATALVIAALVLWNISLRG